MSGTDAAGLSVMIKMVTSANLKKFVKTVADNDELKAALLRSHHQDLSLALRSFERHRNKPHGKRLSAILGCYARTFVESFGPLTKGGVYTVLRNFDRFRVANDEACSILLDRYARDRVFSARDDQCSVPLPINAMYAGGVIRVAESYPRVQNFDHIADLFECFTDHVEDPFDLFATLSMANADDHDAVARESKIIRAKLHVSTPKLEKATVAGLVFNWLQNGAADMLMRFADVLLIDGVVERVAAEARRLHIALGRFMGVVGSMLGYKGVHDPTPLLTKELKNGSLIAGKRVSRLSHMTNVFRADSCAPEAALWHELDAALFHFREAGDALTKAANSAGELRQDLMTLSKNAIRFLSQPEQAIFDVLYILHQLGVAELVRITIAIRTFPFYMENSGAPALHFQRIDARATAWFNRKRVAESEAASASTSSKRSSAESSDAAQATKKRRASPDSEPLF